MHNHHSNSLRNATDEELVRRFVASFECLDELWLSHSEDVPEELLAGVDPDDWNRRLWRPAEIVTPREELAAVYKRLPGRFPELYERLVLSYRWLEVHLRNFTLLANPPGPLDLLAESIFRDPAFVEVLISAGFVPFARGADVSYDPVCFDLNSVHNGDCPIVQFEHEPILCDRKIGKSDRISSRFRELVVQTIELTV